MLDHTGFAVSDLRKSTAFYVTALQPLGIKLLMELSAAQTGSGAHAGFGVAPKPFFWIGDHGSPCAGVLVAFTAQSRAQVVQFHEAALKAGGRDNGKPGLRTHYGNNIEAVCHKPE